MSAAYVGDGRLEPFRKVIDGYVLGPKARSILCGYLDSEDGGQTRYHKEAEKLFGRGWLGFVHTKDGLTSYSLSGRGEAIRKELRDA